MQEDKQGKVAEERRTGKNRWQEIVLNIKATSNEFQQTKAITSALSFVLN